MGVLDDLGGLGFVSQVLASVDQAEELERVELTPIAREITALFMISPALDSPRAIGRSDFDERGLQAVYGLIENLPRFVSSARDRYELAIRPEATGIVTALDVYHWIAERSRTELRRAWPYPKDQ